MITQKVPESVIGSSRRFGVLTGSFKQGLQLRILHGALPEELDTANRAVASMLQQGIENIQTVEIKAPSELDSVLIDDEHRLGVSYLAIHESSSCSLKLYGPFATEQIARELGKWYCPKEGGFMLIEHQQHFSGEQKTAEVPGPAGYVRGHVWEDFGSSGCDYYCCKYCGMGILDEDTPLARDCILRPEPPPPSVPLTIRTMVNRLFGRRT